MKIIKKYIQTTTASAVLLFSLSTEPTSLAEAAAWLKCKIGYSTAKENCIDDTNCRPIAFENDLLDAIDTYSISQAYTHWAVQSLKALADEEKLEQSKRSYSSNNNQTSIFENLELYEKVIQILEIDSDDSYDDVCEMVVDIISPNIDEEEDNTCDETYQEKRMVLIDLLDIPVAKGKTVLTVDDIEYNDEFEHVKYVLQNSVLLTSTFEKIGKEKLSQLWKTLTIKANGVTLLHNYITNIPVKNDICTVSVSLPIETFAQLLEAQGLRCIFSDEAVPADSPCLRDTQKFLQEHPWIRGGIKHLQKHDSIWNSFIARYINMQVVFTYTFNVREFESDTIRINYLLLSQINKWAQNPPSVTTRYRPFQTIEIIVDNKKA